MFTVKSRRATQSRGLRINNHSLWRYVRNVTVNLRFELVMVLAIEEAWESVPYNSSLWEEAKSENDILQIECEKNEIFSLQCLWYGGFEPIKFELVEPRLIYPI